MKKIKELFNRRKFNNNNVDKMNSIMKEFTFKK